MGQKQMVMFQFLFVVGLCLCKVPVLSHRVCALNSCRQLIFAISLTGDGLQLLFIDGELGEWSG